MTIGPFATSALAVVRLLPERLDLFTACVGCAGIGSAIGGAAAVVAGEDIVKCGVIGAVAGIVLGVILALLQGQGVHS